LFERDGSMTGVPSGYVDLDEVLLGFQPSNLIVVAARPGQGKTSFALGAASHVALETRRPVVFFSMEMGYLELTQRMLASEAGVNSRLLRTGRIPESDWTKISHAVGRLAEAPFYIDDNAHLTVMEMRAKCRRLKAMHGDLGLVVVDYLQLMSTPRRSENRQVEVSELSRGLRSWPGTWRPQSWPSRSSTARWSTAPTSARCSPTSGNPAASPAIPGCCAPTTVRKSR
ncbi:MAG TPA: DnaB-like helicase C-terminal domain-containing protein, partial [Acidimicrobiia bacterium]|nr:DnaB-like helicase C-terminal domain-containing protein [Acidimicrobiia bacterium]